MVVIHRPHIDEDVRDFSLIKALLKNLLSLAILLCRDKLWKSKIKAIATIDIVDDSVLQKALNDRVIDTAMNMSGVVQAELAFLSVLAISKFSEELDITSSDEIMAKKGKASKAKLEQMINEKSTSLIYSTHVSAGNPSDEISSASQKLKSNLVIVGNVGRTGVEGLIVGNTSEKFLID